MDSLILVLALAVVFYGLIPGFGAFYVRRRWREFRRRIISASLYPLAEYRSLRRTEHGFVGNLRFFGGLEATQGDDVVWLRSGSLSVAAELKKVAVYWLPSFAFVEAEGPVEINEESLPDETPTRVRWERIFSLPEGTQVFVSGPLYIDRGRPVFRSDRQRSLTVVIYDGQQNTILRRSIWGGRHRNEYVNPFTPGSITAGSFSLLILAYILLRSPQLRLPAIIALTASLFPLLVLLPPGLLFFFLYRNWWKEARFLRAERDMLLLPLRYFPDFPTGSASVRLPDGEAYVMERHAERAEAIARLGAGKIRQATRLGSAALREADYYVFGGPAQGGPLGRPLDPMAELIMIPGHPLELSRRCSKRARLFELLSTGAIVVGLLMNLCILLVLLAALIK